MDFDEILCRNRQLLIQSFILFNYVLRLLSWVSDPEQYEEKQRWLAIPGRCNQCGHIGRNHGKSGCFTCTTNKGCNDTGYK